MKERDDDSRIVFTYLDQDREVKVYPPMYAYYATEPTVKMKRSAIRKSRALYENANL